MEERRGRGGGGKGETVMMGSIQSGCGERAGFGKGVYCTYSTV